jgi:ankyrin repeat protein
MLARARFGNHLLGDFVNSSTYTGQTPLMLACRGGHKEAVTVLVSSGKLCPEMLVLQSAQRAKKRGRGGEREKKRER